MPYDIGEMGLRIRFLRKERALTQTELAHRLGLSVSFLGHIERGTRAASLQTLCTLSDVLGVSTDYLLKGQDASTDDEVKLRINRVFRELRSAIPEGWLDDDG